MASTALALARTPVRRLAALAVLLALIAGALVASVGTAGAAPTAHVTGVYRGGTVFGAWPEAPAGDSVSAGLIQLQLEDGTLAWAYCIEINRSLDTSDPYDASSWGGAGVGGLDVVSYILGAYGPSASPPRDTSFDGAAVQAAIWHFTDGFDLGGSAGSGVPDNGNPAAVIALYDQILADVADGIPAQTDPFPALTISQVDPVGTIAAGDVVRFTIAGTSLSGITASLSANTAGAEFVDCAAPAGPITPSVPNGGDVCVRTSTAGSFTVDATGSAQIRYGTAFVLSADPTRQRLVLGQSVVDRADATISTTVIPDEGSITVTKLVEGDSGFEAVWTFRLFDNTGTQVRPDITVDAATPVGTFTGLPTAGSPYTITEIGSSATSTVVSSSGVTVTPGGDAPVSVTNRYEGRFTVTKVVTGDLTPAAGTTYPFTWECFANGVPTGSDSFVLADGATFTSPLVLAGSECTVTETDANGGTPRVQVGAAPSTPGSSVVVTISHGGPQAVTVTNVFPEAARLTVNKATTGPVTGPFEVTVVCTEPGGASVTTGAEGGVTFSPASPWISPLLPVGSECTVTETGQGNAETVSVTPAGGAGPGGDIFTEVLLPAGGETVTFTNSRAPLQATGQLTVSKAVTGTVTGTFMFTVSCPGVTLPAADAAFTLAAGTSRTLGVTIPAGTTCTVTEATRGDAASTTVSVNGGTGATVPGPQPSVDVTITVDATATVAFTNVREDLPATTTTTAPPTTTTTGGPTTTTTAGPTTTSTPPTPSSAAATAAPTTAAPTSSGSLAFTGNSVDLLLLVAGAMLALGVAFRMSTRRRLDG
jgi:hypothetical protein